MSKYKIIYILPSIVLLITSIMRLKNVPNQLILVGISVLLIFVFLISFLFKHLKKSSSNAQKVMHVLYFLLSILVLVLPLLGVFEQGVIPNSIYAVMLVGIIWYAIKHSGHSLKIFQLDSYRNFILLNLLLIVFNSPIQVVLPDISYAPEFESEYNLGTGPTIYIDEGHYNLHKREGLYTTFANLLTMDGYNVSSFKGTFTEESLESVEILVISNALNQKNNANWGSPVYSAFTKNEIKCLKKWVKEGGALFFIADHMPFGTAGNQLAESFGYSFSNGSVIKKSKEGISLFCRTNKTLTGNSLTNGRDSSEYVDSVVTFTGQAIKIPDAAHPILTFNDDFVHYSPKERNQLDGVEEEEVVGLSQGSYMNYGKGRMVVFGEAAMFTGQLPAGLSFWKKIGMNAPEAKNNYKLLLNIIHWLDRKYD